MNQITWTFPKEIDFCLVPQYVKRIEREAAPQVIIFDLTGTEKIHSSFIGFLIHVKGLVDERGGTLVLKISPSLQRLFAMMKIADYFTPAFHVEKADSRTQMTVDSAPQLVFQ